MEYENAVREAVIYGGGHVSLAAAKLLRFLGYSVTVADDRAEFANKERFYMADKLICAPFEESAKYEFAESAVVMVMTRGHEKDYLCVKELLRKRCAFLGMIGSKRKNAAIAELLKKDGFTDAEIAKIHAPIGLKIGGKTPEEIAVSIAAELLSLGIYSRDYSAVENALTAGSVLVTVIEKSGFAPCEVGAKMAVKDGKAVGTVGGGETEFAAIQLCASVEDTLVKEFDLSNGEAGKSGAVCGGRVKLKFERIKGEKR